MLRIPVTEYGRIPRDALGPRLVRELQRADERHARGGGTNIFDWSRLREIRVLNHVGVVQVPGLTVEILPKVDTVDTDSEDGQRRVQRNLLHMLSITRALPIHDRDLAGQQLRRLPLLESLIVVFASRLLTELRRGPDRRYLAREDNLAVIRGKMLLTEHVRRNVARKDRVYVGYDEFLPDTWLNRILKAACRQLLAVCRSSRAGQLLSEALLELADVEDCPIEPYRFDQLLLDRNTERFRPMVDFARMVLMGSSPSPSAGVSETFSIVFPMDVLFEEYIGRIIRRHAGELGLVSERVHLQARSRRRWLLRRTDGSGCFRMKPDVLVDGGDGSPAIILDTKWKRLLSDAEDSRNGVGQGDLYQLYAYAKQYGSDQNVLLFPRVPGVTGKQYRIDGDDGETSIRVGFVDVGLDLAQDRAVLLDQIRMAMAR